MNEILYKFSAEVAKNGSDEQQAIQGYMELLQLLEILAVESEELQDNERMIRRAIEEIIADEMSHTKTLEEIITLCTDIIPKDD